MENSFKYRAFITYAHEDENQARWLRKKLEGFPIPKNLVGGKGKFGKIPSRLYPIFRDRDELPGSAQLGSVIEEALHDSSHLIVLCSPNAVKSRWVNEEIRLFKKMGKEDRILCLILDGEPMADDLAHSKGKECLPLAVRRKIDADGSLIDEIDEPGAADLRLSGDGEKNAILKIVAGLLGIGLDEIKQRDMIARQRKLALISTFSIFLALSGIGLAAYAFFQKQKANRAEITAIEERKSALEELAKTRIVTQFVQSLFFSLDPQNTSGMDTKLLKTMLDQGVKRAGELSHPNLKWKQTSELYLVRHIVQFVPMINHRNSLNGQSSSLRVTLIPGAKPSQNSHLFMKPWAITSRQSQRLPCCSNERHKSWATVTMR